MSPDTIKAQLESQLPECQVQVEGDGRHFDIVVVSELFAGLRPVKRQQMVYAALREWIADGSLHAVNMRTLTPAEAE